MRVGTDTDGLWRAVRRLSGDPTVIDIVRIVRSLTGAAVEVVVFEQDRAMVVGSLDAGLLQPRPVSPTEAVLARGGERQVRADTETSTAILDRDNEVIGALSVGTYVSTETGEALLGLSRIVTSLLEAEPGTQGRPESLLESTLEQTRRVSAAVVEQLHDGIIVTDAVGSLLVVNAVAREILGLPAGTYPAEMAIDALEFFDADALPVERDRHPVQRALHGEHIAGEQMTAVVDDVIRHIVVSGRPVHDADGVRIGAAVGFRDITEARRYERALQRSALHDHLTGLPNRRQLKDRVDELPVAAAAGDDRPVSETLVDLDNFKVINDTHGHRIGDEVIQIAAHRLAEACGPDDLLVRLGGDEFVVLARGQTIDEAVGAADEMRRRLGEPFDIDGHAFNLTCSIGVAHLEVEGLQEDSLLRYADLALYEAKARGRNRVALFDHRLAEAARTANRQRDFLRQVLAENGLVMNLQPFVDTTSDEIVGFESLARCRTAAGTLVGPGEFLDAASGSGLAWELDRRAFELTCEAAAKFADRRGGLTIACNLSPLSIVQPDFVDHVDRTLERNGIDASSICIEITESAAYDGGGIALNALRAVHRLGVLLALDDFGTGLSALSHLRDLPLAVVKVDRSFVANVETDSSERAIAEAVVRLAHGLGIDVVAEGVETTGQLEWARSVGFDLIQGWYYSPARGLDEVLGLLATDAGGAPRVPAGWGIGHHPNR